jgi:hypothetical protein
MKHRNRWMVMVLFMAGLLLAACAQASIKAAKIPPVKVENIEGSSLKRLTLVPEAAKRIELQTAAVREEPVVRQRKVGGEVVDLATLASATTSASSASSIRVRVTLNESDLIMVDRSKPALVLPLGGNSGATGWTAQSVAAPAGGNAEEENEALYYALDTADHGLTAGQRVLVQVTLVGSSMPRKLIPHAALLYDAHGDTWVYTNPAPLVFVRQHISVNYIEGDRVVLFAGPPTGTAVVTVGAAELYGAETGVGK